MQAVDSRRSRCVGLAGVEVQKEGRSVSVLVPGTGPAATDSSEPGSRRLGLDRDLDLMDASVLYCCSQPRVQRAATRFPWAVAVGVGGGGDVVPHQAGRRGEDGSSEFKTRLKRWPTCPRCRGRGDGDDLSGADGAWCRGERISRRVSGWRERRWEMGGRGSMGGEVLSERSKIE